MNPVSPSPNSSFREIPSAQTHPEEQYPRLFNFSLDCPTRVKKNENQTKPVLYLNRSQWYTMRCQPVVGLTPDSRVRLCLGFSFVNPQLRQLTQTIYSKFQHVHPHDRLVEVRLNDGETETKLYSSEERFPNMLWFSLPLSQLQQQQPENSQSFEFSFRLNFVSTQFFYCASANHPLKMPFDFALYILTMVEGAQVSYGADFFPIRMTWPGRASPLSSSIQARYNGYQSLKIPNNPADTSNSSLPASSLPPSKPLLSYTLHIPSTLDSTDYPVSFVKRSTPVYLEIKPLIDLEHALHRTTIVLGRHRSTQRAPNPLVHFIEYNHHFVIDLELSRLSEVVFDVYYDSRNNAVEIIWIPVKKIELCFHFEWLGTLSEDVLKAKVKFIVETTKLNHERHILEHATCVVKFYDNELDEADDSSSRSSSSFIHKKPNRRLSNSTQLTLPKNRNTRALPPPSRNPGYAETYEAYNSRRRR